MTYSVMLLKAIDKFLQILDVQSECQLKSLLAVSFGFGKAKMFGLSSLLFGFDGLVFFLFAMGFGRSSVFLVALNFGGTTIVGSNLEEIRFRGRCASSFPAHNFI